MNGNVMHIAYICDDKYVLPTLVSISSLCDAVKDSEIQYIVHVCSFSLTNENIKLIDSIKARNVKVGYVHVDERFHIDKLNRINVRSHVSSSALIKFELPNIFYDLDRLLYLDSDIIIKRDISDLNKVDISEYYLAAVKEYWRIHNNYYDRGREDNDYFNSGVMYLNLCKFRQDDLMDKLWEIKINEYNDIRGKSVLMDQDALNKVCSRKCYYLPIKYNCDPKLTIGWANWNILNDTYKTTYVCKEDLFADVCIVHYLGKKDKPWKYKKTPCGDVWENAYLKSVASNIPLNYERNNFSYVELINKIKYSFNERGLLGTFLYLYKTRKLRRIK